MESLLEGFLQDGDNISMVTWDISVPFLSESQETNLCFKSDALEDSHVNLLRLSSG